MKKEKSPHSLYPSSADAPMTATDEGGSAIATVNDLLASDDVRPEIKLTPAERIAVKPVFDAFREMVGDRADKDREELERGFKLMAGAYREALEAQKKSQRPARIIQQIETIEAQARRLAATVADLGEDAASILLALPDPTEEVLGRAKMHKKLSTIAEFQAAKFTLEAHLREKARASGKHFYVDTAREGIQCIVGDWVEALASTAMISRREAERRLGPDKGGVGQDIFTKTHGIPREVFVGECIYLAFEYDAKQKVTGTLTLSRAGSFAKFIIAAARYAEGRGDDFGSMTNWLHTMYPKIIPRIRDDLNARLLGY